MILKQYLHFEHGRAHSTISLNPIIPQPNYITVMKRLTCFELGGQRGRTGLMDNLSQGKELLGLLVLDDGDL